MCAKEADGLADVGSPLPGREVKIVNDEVWLRAASMAEGYWRNGQRVPLVNDEGWYATRDRGEMYNGKLTIVGRLDNLFFSGGEVFSRKKSSALLLHILRFCRCLSFPLPTRSLVIGR